VWFGWMLYQTESRFSSLLYHPWDCIRAHDVYASRGRNIFRMRSRAQRAVVSR
jgi:hypothetical protein